MSILKIARMGHPVLRRRADPVEDPTAPAIHRLIRDMLETLRDADGAGLAAPQVHVPLRVFLFQVPAEDPGEDDDEQPAEDPGEDDDEQPAEDAGEGDAEPPAPELTVLINPEIEPLTDAIKLGWEGCLSVPGLIGAVPRFTKIRYTAVAPNGERIERTVEDFHARVVQHECDHLDGILYPQRMTDLSLLMFQEETRHGIPEEARRQMRDDEEPERTEAV